jgi:hypothetical protein
VSRLVRGFGAFDVESPDDDTRPARRGPLSDDLQVLSVSSRRIWEDPVERLRIVDEILDADVVGDLERLMSGLDRIDSAITEALNLLGLPRGPINNLEPVRDRRYAGRKLPSCTLQINVDVMRRMSAFERGPDTTFRTWVHESIHGRHSFADSHQQEYSSWSGYEEGLAEALARLVVRGHAGLDPIEPRDYDYFLAAYQTLSESMNIECETLLRTLWELPTGRIRSGLVHVIDQLRRTQSLGPLSSVQRATVAIVADRSFATANLSRRPDQTTMLTLWRGRLR